MKILKITENKKAIDFEIEVDKKKWEEYFKKAFNILSKKLKVQGFRQGKIPASIAKGMINDQTIIQKALEINNQEIINELISKKEFEESKALDRVVNFRIVNIKENNLPILLISFEIMPDIKNFSSKDLSKIELPEFVKKPIDKKFIKNNVKAFIKEDAMIMNKTKNDKVEDGDIAIIDFDGYIDNKQFQGGKADNYELEIGSHSFIDNFEEQLIGHKKGDKLDVNVTFPKDYHAKEHANKKATFKVKIKDVKAIEYPKIDEKYLKSKFIKNAKNEQDLEKYIENIFIEEQKIKYRDKVAKILNEYILKNAKVDYIPEVLLNSYKQRMIQQYGQEAQQNKMTLDAYLKKLKVSQEQFMSILNKNANDNVIVALAYEKLLEELKINVAEKDKEELLEKLENYFKNKDKAKEMFEKNNDYNESLILKDKLLDKIPSLTKIKKDI